MDLLSLDVEGSEPAILSTVPWSELTVSVLLLEHHGEGQGRDEVFYNSVVDKGFQLFDHYTDHTGTTEYVFVGRNFYAKNKEYLTKKLAILPNFTNSFVYN